MQLQIVFIVYLQKALNTTTSVTCYDKKMKPIKYIYIK